MALISKSWSVAIVATACALAAVSSGCKKTEAPRCQKCGMMVDAKSAFRTELIVEPSKAVLSFDTPKCAIATQRTRKVMTHLRVQEYYSRAWREGTDVRFVHGSDVLGPMGKDLIPVDPAQIDKFMHDHAGQKSLSLAEVDDAILAELK